MNMVCNIVHTDDNMFKTVVVFINFAFLKGCYYILILNFENCILRHLVSKRSNKDLLYLRYLSRLLFQGIK